MDEEKLCQRRDKLAQLLNMPIPKELSNKDEVNEGPGIHSKLNELPLYSRLTRLHEVERDNRACKASKEANQLLSLIGRIEEVLERNSTIICDIAVLFEYLDESSQLLERFLKNPNIDNALPLPHHVHRLAVEMLEACAWLRHQREWQPSDYAVDWEVVLTKLDQNLLHWEKLAQESKQCLYESRLLKEGSDKLIEILPLK